MRVLVLGGYGLIGTEVVKRLLHDGHDVTGLGRSAQKGQSILPLADWIGADMSKLTSPADWKPYLDNIDAIVNCAGVLQDGLHDSVSAVQRDSVIALINACEDRNVRKFIQISAPGAVDTSPTSFYRTKAAADFHLKKSKLEWTVFRPGLVIAPQAYGGTSLIRTLCCFPIIQPILLANTKIQTVPIHDVSEAVSLSLVKNMNGLDLDLVESESHTLVSLVLKFRKWLGVSEPRAVWSVPAPIGKIASWVADTSGWFGWRPAIRSTAITVLSENVVGNSEEWEKASGRQINSLDHTLDHLPSTSQERLYARSMLLFPLLLIGLSLFWAVSGIIGILRFEEAMSVLAGKMPYGLAALFVILGSIVDIIISAMILFRSTTRKACLASIAVSFSYITGSLIWAPTLWLDPLGPMVKVLPTILLALIVAALAEER